MSFSRAFQWYHSHLDPILPDGTFNTAVLFSIDRTMTAFCCDKGSSFFIKWDRGHSDNCLFTCHLKVSVPPFWRQFVRPIYLCTYPGTFLFLFHCVCEWIGYGAVIMPIQTSCFPKNVVCSLTFQMSPICWFRLKTLLCRQVVLPWS